MINNEIINIILEIFQSNKNFITENDLKTIYVDIQKEENELMALDYLRKNKQEKLDKILNVCFEKGFFTKQDYGELEKSLETLLQKKEETVKESNIMDDLASALEEEKEKEKVEKPKAVKKPVQKKEMKTPVKREKPFTEAEIKTLIEKEEDLYISIPGDKVPKEDNKFYVEVQIKRFIDSGGSDFIVETQKKEGMIQNTIQFKIGGHHEVQDSTPFAFPTDKSEGNENLFFDTVRKYIGSSMGNLNADAKHVVQDASFSIDYRGKSRDFRLSALPSRCYTIPYPRYCIRLTSEGDSINFDNIELLPFMKQYYIDRMITSKSAGMRAITGPTGSGKTTTIYAILNAIDKTALSVGAIEKPIESQLYGVNQTEEDPEERDDKR